MTTNFKKTNPTLCERKNIILDDTKINIKLYITGNSDNKKDIINKMKELVELNFCIVHDWTKNDIIFKNDSLSMCHANTNAIFHSDYFIAIFNDDINNNEGYQNVFIEIGIAIASGKKIFVICNNEMILKNIFLHHLNVTIYDDWLSLKAQLIIYKYQINKKLTDKKLTDRNLKTPVYIKE